jgi:uncharacterized membrane protein
MESSPPDKPRMRRSGQGGRFRVRISSLLFIVALSLVSNSAATPDGAHAFLAQGSVSSRIFHWRPFLAPFHSVLLHYPIGFVTMAFILEIYALFRPSVELRKITRLVMVLSLASAAAVAALGLLRAQSGDYASNTLSLHRAFGMAVPACIILSLALQTAAIRAESRRLLYGYRGLLAGTLMVLVIAGHQGGNLTHGSRYLVQNAPEFVKTLLNETEPAEAKAERNSGSGDGTFAEKVRPLLEAKCLHCHGAEKHKGGYRLDVPEVALKGGESSRVAIQPGDPLQSNLVRLILLPRDHDDVMPPEGKEPLTPDEIMVLIRWIQAGALFAGTSPAASVEPSPISHGQ